jgi:hypothetical protein
MYSFDDPLVVVVDRMATSAHLGRVEASRIVAGTLGYLYDEGT